MRGSLILALVFFCLTLVWSKLSMAECPRYQTPSKGLNNAPTLWGQTDSGVIVDGFLEIMKPDAQSVFPTEHGVDLSSFNTVSYQKIKECGGGFGFVRLDDSFERHVKSISAQKMTAIPYVFFPIPESLRKSVTYSKSEQGSRELDQHLAAFEKIGADAASQLLDKLSKSSSGLQRIEFGGITGKLLAVDIEQKFIDEGASNAAQRVAYGRAYAHALCSWVRRMREFDNELLIILYTMPAVYGDYLRNALPEDNSCINGLPVWLAHTTADGGDSLYSSLRGAASPFSDQSAQRLCLVGGGNRCIIHQYSHRAIFGALGKNIKGIPPHIDINRWFPITVVNTDAGPQYVRRDWIKKEATPPPLRVNMLQ